MLIGRLALDRSLRGQKLGEVLLADALTRIVDATRTVGARFVVVDALHEKAAALYERLGFVVSRTVFCCSRSSPTWPRPTTRADASGTSSPSAGLLFGLVFGEFE